MRKTLSQTPYIAWALFFFTLTYSAIAWIPLIRFVGELAAQTDSYAVATHIIAQVLWGGLFDLSMSDTGYALLLALLTGVNFSMLIFYARGARVRPRITTSAGALGFFIGVLGFGCAACGALFARTLLAGIAGIGLADKLPESGFAYQTIGVALILYSIWQLNRVINDPQMCEQ